MRYVTLSAVGAVRQRINRCSLSLAFHQLPTPAHPSAHPPDSSHPPHTHIHTHTQYTRTQTQTHTHARPSVYPGRGKQPPTVTVTVPSNSVQDSVLVLLPVLSSLRNQQVRKTILTVKQTNNCEIVWESSLILLVKNPQVGQWGGRCAALFEAQLCFL
jgi:hypothetical protein